MPVGRRGRRAGNHGAKRTPGAGPGDRPRARPPAGPGPGLRLGRVLLGLAVGPLELLVELVDAAGGVDELGLAGVERVRRAGDVDDDQRVFVAVLELRGL